MQVFILNLSAPFIPQFFKVQLEKVLPFVDIVICNESEAAAYAGASGLPKTDDMQAIARALATLPKSNASRARTVIITQGPGSTVVVSGASPDDPKIFPVHALGDDQIVDTNGAGDAFAGGFIGAHVAGKSLEECIEAGHKMGSMSVQLVRGSPFPSAMPPAPSLTADPVGRPTIQVAEGPDPLSAASLSFRCRLIYAIVSARRFQQRDIEVHSTVYFLAGL
jgi:sugar/nucleoside kinase (ribokinase family)